MRFSIITCTYNSAEFLSKNIDSVKNQSFTDFEHIFIDSFSTDGTVKLIEEYKSQFPNRVKLLQIPANGISNAMNEGIKRASGEYIIHLHSDDSLFDSQVLIDVDKFLTKNNSDWIYGKINVREENGQAIGVFPSKKLFQWTSQSRVGKYVYKLFNYIPHQSVFIKKEVFNKFGNFDETLSSKMDPDLWFRIIGKTNWAYYNRVISNYSIRKGSESASIANIAKNKIELRQVRKRYLNFFEIKLAALADYLGAKKNNNYR